MATGNNEPKDPASTIAEQEATIKRLKERIQYWADNITVEDLESVNILVEMVRVAKEL